MSDWQQGIIIERLDKIINLLERVADKKVSVEVSRNWEINYDR